MNCQNFPVFLEFIEPMENQGKDWILQAMVLTTQIVTIYPIFLKLIEQIGVKIGYGKVMILSTCRKNCQQLTPCF